MSQDTNNGYYDDSYNYSVDWNTQPQQNAYRGQPTPMGQRRRGKRFWGWFFGILAVLALLVLTSGVFFLIRNMGVQLKKTDNGIQFSVTTARPWKKDEVQTDPVLPQVPEEEKGFSGTSEQTKVPEAAVGTGAELQISDSKPGMQNISASQDGALSLQEIYEKNIGSVVSIMTQTRSGSASGTGIIMTDDGYIITNCHVVSDAVSVSVLTTDERTMEAAIVGSDEISDLAVLKVEAEGLKQAEFGDSTVLRTGDSVIAIGDPLGVKLRGTMTAGIVSAINRDLTVEDRTLTLIQTDAALNNGNSGGPLINCYGQVIGINTMKMSSYYSSATVEGLGFAIPIASAKPIIDELIENGYVSGRPAIGISGEALPRTYQTYYRLPSGIYITGVTPGSDAENKGLSEGDIITAINGTDISSLEELNAVKNQFSAGDTVTLTVYRGGQYYDVDVRLIDQATGR